MKTKRLVIYAFWEKSTPFMEWKKVLSHHNFKIRTFYNIDKFLEALLFKPPDIVFYYYKKDPKSLQILLRDIKIQFNLVKLLFILIVDKFEAEILSNYIYAIDEILTTSSDKEEVLVRTKLALSKLERISDNNPLTGLPGNVSIERNIKLALEKEEPSAVIYVDLDNFKAYNDLYGFSKGDEMIKNLSKILLNTLQTLSKESFVGHIGGDDFVLIVPLEKAEEVSKEIIKRFDSLVPKFVNPKDLQRGYLICKDRKGNLCKFPLPSVSLAIVPVHKGKFKHIGEVAERAGQIKKLVKSVPGSAYFIDRRA